LKPDQVGLTAGVAASWGCVVAVGAYAVVRGIQFFVYPDPDPATLVWSAHAGFFWRCWTCAYAGGIASFVAYLGTRARFDLSVRALAPAIAVVALLLAVQVTFLP
jgi:signal transduction histidine kinase